MSAPEFALSAIASGLSALANSARQQNDAGRVEALNALERVLARGMNELWSACGTSGPTFENGVVDLIDDIARFEVRNRIKDAEERRTSLRLVSAEVA
jgi:hypothetical protein